MRKTNSFRLTLLALFMAILLPACATATRGSTTLFIVETVPVGAKATTTLPTKEFGEMTQLKLKRIEAGKIEQPDFEYRFCEPTPCGIKMPRKKNFHVLVTKDGYAPQVHKIGYMHRKEIKKETQRNTALAAGATGVAGAAMGASLASTFATVGATSATATGAVLFAAPVVLVGGMSLGVDAATGANYDVWPNPLPLTLVETNEGDPERSDVDKVKADFAKMQKTKAMSIPPSPRELREEKRRRRELKRKGISPEDTDKTDPDPTPS